MLRTSREWIVSPSAVMAWSRVIPGLNRRLARPPISDVKKVRRLGVLRPDGIGDILLTTGMLRELRRQLPDTRITLICQAQWAAWMRTCPWVDDVVDVDMALSGDFREPKRLSELMRFINRVWPLDLEVLLQPGTLYWYVPSRALAWFSGAPLRFCWEDPAPRVDTGGAFHTHSLPYPNHWHETEKCFRMLQEIGIKGEGRRLDSWSTPEDARQADDIVHAARGDRSKLIALGLAASEQQRRWPRERFLQVVRDLREQDDVAFVALGGSDVAESCRWLSQQIPEAISYPGDKLPLGAIWSVISHCDAYIGNDSGFMHMAAASSIPVVAVIGVPDGAPLGTRGDELQTGPYDTVSRVIRPPAGTPSNTELDASVVCADAVTAAARDLLRNGAM
ncbi:MAG: glycosyltransferase family 9 protein [Gemmatimonadales bacterium]